VKATALVASSYVPFSQNPNLIEDPEFNGATFGAGHFTGDGGAKIITDPAIVYSGSRCGGILSDYGYRLNWSIGTISYLFTSPGNTLKPNTKYGVKAKVWAVDGTMYIDFSDGVTGSAILIGQSSTWTDFYQEFTTGATIGVAPKIRLKTVGTFLTTGYIDNWEVREIPSVTTEINSKYDKNIFANIVGKQVIINGTKEGDCVKVYNTNGSQVNFVKATGDKTILDLTKGVYVVKVNSNTLKVVL